MKLFSKTILFSVIGLAIFASNANAGWVVVNEDGTKVPYTSDCCHKVVKKKRLCTKKRYCGHCDYSKFPEAQTFPLAEGEKLAPARLGFCGKK